MASATSTLLVPALATRSRDPDTSEELRRRLARVAPCSRASRRFAPLRERVLESCPAKTSSSTYRPRVSIDQVKGREEGRPSGRTPAWRGARDAGPEYQPRERRGRRAEIEVKLPGSSQRSDEDIARAVVNALKSDVFVPDDKIKVTVSKGWVRLEGEVDWYFQKESAEKAVRNLYGVMGVSNLITVKPRVSPTELRARIEEAPKRSAELDARRISVEVQDGKAILRGIVRSWAAKEEAERAAWAAPGIHTVENLITLDDTD